MLCLRRDSHDGQNSDVRMNDLAFSLHCNLCSTIMLAQILMYPGDNQRVTPVCWASTGGISLAIESSMTCCDASFQTRLVFESQMRGALQ